MVLIDTWWNVNWFYIFSNNPTHAVLIDTWWNVNNMDNLIESEYSSSFNRYMVECEFHLCRYSGLGLVWF